MFVRMVAERYGEALFLLAREQGILEKLIGELETIQVTFRRNLDLQKAFYSPVIPEGVKKSILLKLFSGRVLPVVLNFLLLLVEKRREEYLEEIISAYLAAVRRSENIVQARVTTAIPLAEESEKQLSEALSRQLGKKVKTENRVDPAILGGVIVQINDLLMDGSLRHQLEEMRERILRPASQETKGSATC